jgi:GntR family transcriptional regulator of vanillate catabolism
MQPYKVSMAGKDENAMASQIGRVTAELRRRILTGELPPGERIVELNFASELHVSRTPLRLALGELEKEGLLERLPKRGYCVRRVTLDDIASAIDVRGVLEGMAARLLAESGASPAALDELNGCVREGRALLDEASRTGSEVDGMQWAAVNARFHRALMEGAANPVLASALDLVARTPMAAPGALGFNGVQPQLEFTFLERAQFDHEDVVQAIKRREGVRAEMIMREHARRSRDNKRLLMQGMLPGEGREAAAA